MRLWRLPITVEQRPAAWLLQRILPLTRTYRLTAYDAAYLELAIREGLPLATLDDDLRRAASAAGVAPLGSVRTLSPPSPGKLRAIEAQSRAGITVREFLRLRYGVACGPSERGDGTDRKRFLRWLADARWRIRKMRSEGCMRRAVQLQRAWRVRTPAMVM